MLLELKVKRLPVDRREKRALKQYAAALAQLVPGLRHLTLSPAPTAASAREYAKTLSAVGNAVHSVLPGVAVGPLVAGRGSPKATVKVLGRALRHGADVVGVPPRPAPRSAAGPRRTFPPSSRRSAARSRSSHRCWSTGSRAPKRAYPAAITEAACSSGIAGLILDRLFHGRHARAAARRVAAAAAPAQRGTVLCPGLTSRAAASAIEFPTELDASHPAAVVLACARDCLYLITLNDARGRPVAARRGALRGARRGALTLELPKAKLRRARYRLDVRLVDRVNPGAVTRLTSEAASRQPVVGRSFAGSSCGHCRDVVDAKS